MTVLPDTGGVYAVVGKHGSNYHCIDREGRGTCPDHMHSDVRCKQTRRVAIATSTHPLYRCRLHDLLGMQTDMMPRMAATVGGIIDAGDEWPVIEKDDEYSGDDCPDEYDDRLVLRRGHASSRIRFCNLSLRLLS